MRLVIFLLVFIACLIIGLLVGENIGSLPDDNNNVSLSPTLAEIVATPATGQSNILVIGAHNLKANKPQLESIWLILSLPDSSRFKLIPIFPVALESQPGYNQMLVEAFIIGPDGNPVDSFLNELRDANIWWSNIIILDRFGLIEIVDFVGGVDMGNGRMKGTHIVGGIHSWTEDQQTAEMDQILFLRGLCQSAAQLSPFVDLSQIFSMIPQQIRTDLDLVQVVDVWQKFGSTSGGFSCDFPTVAP